MYDDDLSRVASILGEGSVSKFGDSFGNLGISGLIRRWIQWSNLAVKSGLGRMHSFVQPS